MIPKFRAWDKEKKIIGIVDGIKFDEDEVWEISFSGDCWRDASNYVLMQSTGLHDKNGKEIFEGDVVQQFDDRYEIKYDVERAGWKPFATDDGCGCCSWELASVEYSEVLGNIHQHPHLLETKGEN